MFDLIEFMLEFLPEFVSIGNAAQSARESDAAFDQRLAMFTAVTLASHQHPLGLRDAAHEQGGRQ